MCYLCPIVRRGGLIVAKSNAGPCLRVTSSKIGQFSIRTFGSSAAAAPTGISRLAPQTVAPFEASVGRGPRNDEVSEDPELRTLRVGKNTESARLAEIIKTRIQNNRPTLVESSGSDAVLASLKAFTLANRKGGWNRRAFLDLSVQEAKALKDGMQEDGVISTNGLALPEGAQLSDIVAASTERTDDSRIPMDTPWAERMTNLKKKLSDLDSMATSDDTHPIRALYFPKGQSASENMSGFIGFIPQRESIKITLPAREGFEKPYESWVVVTRFEPVTINSVPEDNQRVYEFYPGKKGLTKPEMGELAQKLAEMWSEHLTNGRPEPRPTAIGADATYRMMEILSMSMNYLEQNHDGKIFACICDHKKIEKANSYTREDGTVGEPMGNVFRLFAV